MKFPKLAAVGLAIMTQPVFADSHVTGVAEDGKSVFKKCKACHSVIDADGEAVVKGGKNGPNLYGVLGRLAGTQEDFSKFSKSLMASGSAGLEWNEEDFVKYVADTEGFLKEYLDDKKAKSKMSFKLKKEQDAKDVWAFLVSVGPEIVLEDSSTDIDAEENTTSSE